MLETVFNDRYEKLNDEQKRAVDTIDGPVLVVAGPGSGKTELLSLRVANILRTQDVGAQNILCLTFTESAAANMRKRLATLIGNDAYKVGIFTFHSFGTWIIQAYPEHFFGGAHFEPSDEIGQLVVMRDIFDDLPHDNPLSSIDPNGAHVYLEDALSRISSLKRAGISPSSYISILEHNHAFIESIAEEVDNVLSQRVSLKVIDSYSHLYDLIVDYDKKHLIDPSLYHSSLASVLAESLGSALREVSETGKASPLSEWKGLVSEKVNGKHVLKAGVNHERSLALANIYNEYRKRIRKAGKFDFEDMLVEVIDTIANDETLRASLAEKFQYVLVDEYQDTNDAQFKLVLAIASHPVVEGRPNIMAVGDDDQAIYRFQGADLSNILDFKNRFVNPTIIVLTKNYRSKKPIVSLSRSVILSAEDRLETRIPDLTKELEAMSGDGLSARFVSLPSEAHEYTWVADDIVRRLKEGASASSIAVLGRGHAQLEACVAHLNERDVPIRYERQLNVLTQTHVSQIVTMMRYVASLSSSDPSTPPLDELLPEILSYSFWGLDRSIVWRLSQFAYKNKYSWLEAMEKYGDASLFSIALFFITLSALARHEPAEIILDYLIGSDRPMFSTSDDPDEPVTEIKPLFGTYSSPFREYYFGGEKFESNRAEYVSFLSSLRVFVSALRDHRKGERITIHDTVQFVDLHTKHNKLVADTSPFVSAPDAVSVMTAHRAKGLEWETVYVIGCVDEIWAKKGRSTKLPFPKNLPIAPAGDTEDDYVRIFYVAITRAKDELVLTSHAKSDNGKEVQPLRFLNSSGLMPITPDVIPQASDVLQASLRAYHTAPLSTDEKSLLNDIISDYRLSVTHLNTFLNVTRGGPRTFLQHNLLRFPQSKTPSAALGTALHASIEYLHRELRNTGSLPSDKNLEAFFLQRLERERLTRHDHALYGKRGIDALLSYVDNKRESFKSTDIFERSFSKDGVCAGSAPITGAIDRITVDGNDVHVTDFKTGKAPLSWKPKSDTEAIKLHNYRRQLAFYRVLVEGSQEFQGKKMAMGTLEFLEPVKNSNQFITLETDISDEEKERVIALADAVYKKIVDLDFPDTDKYAQSLSGIKAFEEDILSA